ncbi:MAG: hotdog fold thioesterase [Thermodesulfobacteriota bacterium]
MNQEPIIDRSQDPLGFAREVVGKDPFATFLGIEVEEVRDAYSRVSLTIRDDYCNAGVRTHGGVIFSLADQAFAVACNSRGYQAYALEVKIDYLRATGPGDRIVAEATPVHIGKRVSLWNLAVRTDSGEMVAAAQGLAYHFV